MIPAKGNRSSRREMNISMHHPGKGLIVIFQAEMGDELFAA